MLWTRFVEVGCWKRSNSREESPPGKGGNVSVLPEQCMKSPDAHRRFARPNKPLPDPSSTAQPPIHPQHSSPGHRSPSSQTPKQPPKRRLKLISPQRASSSASSNGPTASPSLNPPTVSTTPAVQRKKASSPSQSQIQIKRINASWTSMSCS